MHVGWATTFKPPPDRPRPSFEQLRDHIEGRLSLDPRFRQKLARVPLGLNAPVWIDDEGFEVGRHVVGANSSTLTEVIDDCMSSQLERGRPLWQFCVADRLDDGRIGVVGKAHHCMVDGIAAVQLAALLLDPTPDPQSFDTGDWRPDPTPGGLGRLARGVLDQAVGDAGLLRLPLRAARSPVKALRVANQGLRMARATADLLRPARPVELLNAPISPLRHLARAQRPLDDLKLIKESFGTTVNDVILAVSASGMRRLFQEQGQQPLPLKTMVPVNVRKPSENGQDGNRISFMFVDLPCDEPDPVRRLQSVHAQTSDRKGHGGPQGMERALNAVGYLPQPVRDAVSHVFASPLVFNLTVSNIPGPAEPMYMLGCELEEAYPVVPIPDGHALSIGVTTIRDRACFGLYADRELLDADLLAGTIDEAVDELVHLS